MTYQVSLDVTTYQKIDPIRATYPEQNQAISALESAMQKSGISFQRTQSHDRVAFINPAGDKIAEISRRAF